MLTIQFETKYTILNDPFPFYEDSRYKIDKMRKLFGGAQEGTPFSSEYRSHFDRIKMLDSSVRQINSRFMAQLQPDPYLDITQSRSGYYWIYIQ